jgi:hypothetical protein
MRPPAIAWPERDVDGVDGRLGHLHQGDSIVDLDTNVFVAYLRTSERGFRRSAAGSETPERPAKLVDDDRAGPE